MKSSRKTKEDEASKRESHQAPSPQILGAATALGAVAALWALLQWSQLLIARMGGSSFCAISDTLDCQTVWDSPLASQVHTVTGMPVAAWGLCWGLVAMALPLLCLIRSAEDKPSGHLPEAFVLTAAAGIAVIVLMLIASLAEGALCVTCLGTYAIVSCYGAVAWRAWRQRGLPTLTGGLASSVGATAIVYLVLLVPGLRTPQSNATTGIEHLPPHAVEEPASAHKAPAPVQQASELVHGVDLGAFIASLPLQGQQALSNSIAIYKASPQTPMRRTRVLEGNPSAPVRITDFTDILCGHCATLNRAITELRQKLPHELMAVESRYFPLDGGCNDLLHSPSTNPVRCLAAKAQICMEGQPEGSAYRAQLFAHHRNLTEDLVYSLAEPTITREQLKTCINAPETQKKLDEDIQWAASMNIDGTPLVLINGKKATSFAPFLFAIVLTEGNADHPVFASLPPPDQQAYLH